VTTLLVVLVVSYLLGSIPTSILVSRLVAGIDIRERGSGNAGATNIYRVLGIGPALLVGVVDIGKGVVAALVVGRLQIGAPAPVSEVLLQLIAGGTAVVGHVWTVFAGFRGGKGVATAVGVLGGIIPASLGTAAVVWVILLLTVRIMSVASMGAAVVLPVAVWIWETTPEGTTPGELIWFTSGLALLILFTHRRNIGRLVRGEEHRLGRRQSESTANKPDTSPAQPTRPRGSDQR
jgi:glycerol-3-phosphate acyltransferase PlsY